QIYENGEGQDHLRKWREAKQFTKMVKRQNHLRKWRKGEITYENVEKEPFTKMAKGEPLANMKVKSL
ncbi:4121_t:CDS:1, partial [Dentiscutata heterogama]